MTAPRVAFVVTALVASTLGACGSDADGVPTTDAVATDTRVADTASPAPDTASPTLDTASPAPDAATPAPDTNLFPPDTLATVDTVTPSCVRTGWEPEGTSLAAASLSGGEADALFLDSYSSDDGVPYDILGLELYYYLDADDGPHTFTFAGENYETCHTCLLIYADCPDEGACGKAFLAQSGTLTISTNGGPGGRLVGALADVTLTEVTIDANTYVSTPVDGGETWCVPSFAFDEEIGTFASE